jgi:hypothetical protein
MALLPKDRCIASPPAAVVKSASKVTVCSRTLPQAFGSLAKVPKSVTLKIANSM